MPTEESRQRVLAEILAERGFTQSERLREALSWVELQRGDVLFEQGQQGDALYVVIRGRVSILVRRPEGGEPQEIASYTRGDIFGEFALLADQPRAATVRALRETLLARIERDAAESLFAEPSFMLPFVRLIAARAAQNEGKRERPKVIGLITVPGGAPGDVRAAARLASFFDSRADCDVLTIDALPAELAVRDGVLPPAVHDWLNDREQGCRFLVLTGESTTPDWNREIIARVDSLVWLAGAGTDTGRLRSARGSLGVDRITASLDEFVVVGYDADAVDAAAAARWRRSASYARVFHVCRWGDDDLARIARRLAGDATALVLSGGGARAFAHIGVIRAATERGLPIDVIGGTSVGSVIAAQFAAGWSYDDMLRRNAHTWDRLARQFTLPVVSVWSDRMLNRMLEEFFGDTRIEDLRRETFVCVTDLDSCEARYRREGLVRHWCRASMSLPAMWPPFCDEEGVLYVDGGVLDNLPVAGVDGEIGRVVASNVSRGSTARVSSPDCVPHDGWSALAMALRGNLEAPGIAATIYRTAVAGSLGQFRQARERADLFIEPVLADISINDYARIGEIAEAGYREAAAILESECRRPGGDERKGDRVH